ncbi:hypothetical protein [Haloplanus salilacus]|uniref:hypothetical protein n=1 Tax=Haloplanus salilacus TaxID=2949994 RepID=UPI0030D0D744
MRWQERTAATLERTGSSLTFEDFATEAGIDPSVAPDEVRNRINDQLNGLYEGAPTGGVPGDPLRPLPMALSLDERSKWVAGEAVDGGETFAGTWDVETGFGFPFFEASDGGSSGPSPGLEESTTRGPLLEPRTCWATRRGSGKQGLYFGGRSGFRAVPEAEYPIDGAPPGISSFYPLREYTVSEIDEIGYFLREPSPLNGVDVYLSIYTAPEDDGDDTAWYDSRLQALPAEANGGDPSFTPGRFNAFATSAEEPNVLNFFDSGRAETGDIPKPSPEDQVTLDALGDGPVDWATTPEGETRDYSDETVLGLSIQTGSDSSSSLEAYVDGVGVVLETNETLVLNLGVGVDEITE